MKTLAKIGIIIGVILVLALPATALAEGKQDGQVETAKVADPGGGGGY